MADEITFQIRLTLVNENLNDSYSSGSLRADQNLGRLVRNTQPVGNVEEQLDPGDIVTPGMAVFVNLSTTETDYVEIGNYTGGTFYPFLKVAYGDQQMCRIGIPTAQLYAKSNNAAGVVLFYIIYNE